MPRERAPASGILNLRDTAMREALRLAKAGQADRTALPLSYLRQQAHLTAPAANRELAVKALSSPLSVASRLLDRFDIDAVAIGDRLSVDPALVTDVLAGDGAPVVVLDLEDGIAPQLASQARANVVAATREVPRGKTLRFVRPAGLDDSRCVDDLTTMLIGAAAGLPAAEYPIDGVVFPKVRRPEEVEWLHGLLSTIETQVGLEPNRIRVTYQVETAWGLLNLAEIALAAKERLSGLILGTVDLSAELMLPSIRYAHPISEWARRAMITVAGAMGVPAIDGMTLGFPVARPDLSRTENRTHLLDRMAASFDDTRYSIDVGMAGRWVGHPLQLVAALLAFRSTYTPQWAEGIAHSVETFSQALARDAGAVANYGELMDVGTDRYNRMILRRAAAWGVIDHDRAIQLGLISASEGDTA